MKPSTKIFLISLLVVLLIFNPGRSRSQNLMSVSEELLQNSERFEVSVKGGGVMLKYQYNSYRLVSAKGGWMKSKYNSQGGYETSKSEKKISFEFVSDNGDSALVNLNRTTNYEGIDKSGFTFFGKNSTLTLGGYQEVSENSDNLFGIIETNMADSIWNFIVSEKLGTNVDGHSVFVGWLTDGNRRIDIVPVFRYQNPKKKRSTLDVLLGTESSLRGFEFMENASSM